MNETNDSAEAIISKIEQLKMEFKQVKDQCNCILAALSRLQPTNPLGMLSADDVQALSTSVDVGVLSDSLPF